jgi:murein DD-endopeptidase MepM/ murein hydrolase activator NlpD
VPRGTTVAFEGSTGWSTGPHVHFEIRVYGAYKDPCIWLGC